MSNGRHVVRFGKAERIQHGIMMVSFLALAATGLPLVVFCSRGQDGLHLRAACREEPAGDRGA